MGEFRMKILKNYLYNAGYQILVLIVPLVTTPYVNRILGPHGVGINTYTNTIIQYFILFGSIGITLYGNRQIAYSRDNKYKMSINFWEIQIIKLLCIFIAIVAFFIYLIFISHYKYYMLLQFINLFAAIFDISWFYQGIEDFKTTVIRNTFVRIISAIAIFIFIRTREDTYIYILIIGFSTLLGNLTLWTTLKKNIVFVKLSDLHPMHHFMPSFSLFIPQVAVQVYQIFNKTILGIMVGTNAAGFYYDADTIIKMFLTLVTAIGTVMLPHAANEFIKGNNKKLRNMLYISANITTCITVAFSFGIAAIAWKFAPLFFGSEFTAVGKAMFLESPVIYFAGISGVIGTQYLIPTNHIKPYTVSLILGAVVSIVLNFIFIPIWGLSGAMYVTVISEIVVTIYQLFYVKINNLLNVKRMFADTFKYLFIGFFMFIIVATLDKILGEGIVFITIEVLSGALVYIIGIIITKPRVFYIVKAILFGSNR